MVVEVLAGDAQPRPTYYVVCENEECEWFSIPRWVRRQFLGQGMYDIGAAPACVCNLDIELRKVPVNR